MSDERSISDRLADLGYGHRRDGSSHNAGKHEVFVIETGEVLGWFHAHEAVERFLSDGRSAA